MVGDLRREERMCEMCSLDSYLRQMGENVGDVIIRLDSYLRQIRGENVGDVIIRLDSYLRQMGGENGERNLRSLFGTGCTECLPKRNGVGLCVSSLGLW